MPITYQVERLRDGKSYATRLVKALQHDKPVFILLASYTLPPIDLPPLKGNAISPFSFTPTKQALSHSLRFAHGNASERGYEGPSTAGPGETDNLAHSLGVAAKFEIPFPDCIAPYEECEEEEFRWERFMQEKMGEGSRGRTAVAEYIRVSKQSICELISGA
jgi:acyl-CoA thioesterase 8